MNLLDLLKEFFGWGEFNRERLGGAMRSFLWPKVRKIHLLNNPLCAVCETKGKLLAPLQVHHCQPFHLQPELELLDSNLITLCQRCHLLLGHLGSFKSFNKDIRNDAETLKLKIRNRP